MNYLGGLILATISLALAMWHLNQGPSNYWDFVAFAMVFGGTIAVAVIIFPWTLNKALYAYARKLMFNWQPNRQQFIHHCLETLSLYRQGAKLDGLRRDNFEERLLAEGYELLRLGIRPDRIEAILSERIAHFEDIGERVAGTVLSLGKYPPAFGLTGTVLGLVELMKGVSSGMAAQETGLKMAIALVATLYGLLVANLFINPAGEQIRKIVYTETKLAEMALQTILMASDDVTLLEAQEMLNSLVLDNERVDFIGSQAQLGEAA